MIALVQVHSVQTIPRCCCFSSEMSQVEVHYRPPLTTVFKSEVTFDFRAFSLKPLIILYLLWHTLCTHPPAAKPKFFRVVPKGSFSRMIFRMNSWEFLSAAFCLLLLLACGSGL